MPQMFIGLMSGTSLDGIDAVLVDFCDKTSIIGHHYVPFTEPLRKDLHHLCSARNINIESLGAHHTLLGELYAQSVIDLLDKSSMAAHLVSAIGCHGQTIRHLPEAAHPCSLQIGNAAIIAEKTGITTVTDFRSRDIAAGGQGAPLVPAFHRESFYSGQENRAVLNIGGIANITLLPADGRATGFDTGPGNTLLDAWFQIHNNGSYDDNGRWAASGQAVPELLETLLADEYFSRKPPKSSGREYFNLEWLEQYRKDFFQPQDIQATLSELTAQSIRQSIRRFSSKLDRLIVCGGGACNHDLMRRLKSAFSTTSIASSDAFGLAANQVEAAAFAWLAKQTLSKKPGNIPEVTGARHAAIMGAVYYA